MHSLLCEKEEEEEEEKEEGEEVEVEKAVETHVFDSYRRQYK